MTSTISECDADTLKYYVHFGDPIDRSNWSIGVILLILIPIAITLSVEFSAIVSSKVNDVRSANSCGILMLLPLGGIYLAGEIGLISLDTINLLIISGILSAIDVSLFFVSTATFHREEIFKKWK